MSHDAGGWWFRVPPVLMPGVLWWLMLAVGLALTVGSLPASAQPTFPSSGYQTILVDPEDPGVPDNVDILSIGYQQDGTYAYFKITVQDGPAHPAGFSSDRFYLYMDLDHDGLADLVLRNRSAVNAALDNWTGDHWASFSSGWCSDPNDTPDDHVYMACKLSDLNGGDFAALGAAEDTPGFDDGVRDPHDDAKIDEVTDGMSSNPTVAAVSGFDVREGKGRLSFSWRAAAAPSIAGFNLYAWREGKKNRQKLNKKLIPANGRLTGGKYSFACGGRGHGARRYWLEVVALDGAPRSLVAAHAPDCAHSR